MKTQELYNQRLLLFAKRLNSIEYKEPFIREVCIQWIENYVKTWYQIAFNKQVFWELPAVFDEWTYTVTYGDVVLKDNPKCETGINYLNFFNLHPMEFTHLFDVEGGFQNIDIYGGKCLDIFSSPSDVAYNIVEFVKRKS